MVQDLKDGGTFLLNCDWDMAGLEEHLPGQAKRYIAEHNIKFYTIDGIKLGIETGMGARINTILQAAFFKLANIIPIDDAVKYMKDAATASYMKKGEDVVKKNHNAIDAGLANVVEVKVPESWKDAKDENLSSTATGSRKDVVDFVNNIQHAVNGQEGNKLPVSAFKEYVDGSTPSGAAAFEKRGVATTVPSWDPAKCIQCNQCSFVCPHAVIRPVLMTEAEADNAPQGLEYKDAIGAKELKFHMAISPLDCTGCGSCVNICPAKEKALTMQPLESQLNQAENWEYAVETVTVKKDAVSDKTVKASQFAKPYFEFSGACAGCGETPYAKLITQLFGDRMYIANAKGCSSIWGNSSPSTPYTVNEKGQGPAWSNSLFEDNAEHGYGMYTAQKVIRENLAEKTHALLAIDWTAAELKEAAQKWLDTMEDGAANKEAAKAYIAALEESICDGCDCDACKLASEILSQKDYLSKKSVWIFGGDGWAYDIGFGGVDHVLAQNEDVNIFVFDTEVYSNTGGQASKASNIGQVAQFAAAGKETKKKSLAEIAMSYGYIYVAQVAMGANQAQTLKAIAEAEAYHGPSLIIGYAPCEMHSIKGGMMHCQEEMKKAVDCGYWNMFRFDPSKETGKFTLDSKQPKGGYQEFLMNEARYSRLTREFPERANELFERNEESAKARYEHLLKLVEMYKD